MAFAHPPWLDGFSETCSSTPDPPDTVTICCSSDLARTGYFFLRGNPIQFKVTAIMTVCWDLGTCTAPRVCAAPWSRLTRVQRSSPSDSCMAQNHPAARPYQTTRRQRLAIGSAYASTPRDSACPVSKSWHARMRCIHRPMPDDANADADADAASLLPLLNSDVVPRSSLRILLADLLDDGCEVSLVLYQSVSIPVTESIHH